MKPQLTPTQTKLTIVLALSAVAFSITLAVLIGNRLSDQALSVLAGATCGVGAAIPTSLLVIAVTARQTSETNRQTPLQNQYPPVVVVAPGTQQPQLPQAGYPRETILQHQPQPRTFTVVGDVD